MDKVIYKVHAFQTSLPADTQGIKYNGRVKSLHFLQARAYLLILATKKLSYGSSFVQWTRTGRTSSNKTA
jgi:hypothetical protein